jgi:hypothetical protein
MAGMIRVRTESHGRRHAEQTLGKRLLWENRPFGTGEEPGNDNVSLEGSVPGLDGLQAHITLPTSNGHK